MSEFISALTNPDIPFLRYALFAGIVASIAFGVMGTYVVTRRISYIAGAISHCALGGIGGALYVSYRFKIPWLTPIIGAIIATLLAALIIGFVNKYIKEREDSVIAALWAAGMGLGIIFIHLTPGYIDPMSYLFGDIQIISLSDLWLIITLDSFIVFTVILFYNKFIAICFDEEFSRIRGISVDAYYLLLLLLIALTIVLLVNIVGVIMVIALLTIPASIAGQFTKRLWSMMLISIIGSICFTSSGLFIGYTANLPTGPVIILLATTTFFIVHFCKIIYKLRKKGTQK